jgi:beta-lactam-binding protein with PASTA domain
VIIILLLLLAFFGFSSGPRSGGVTTYSVPARSVPDVRGLASPYAEQHLRRAGFVPVRRWCTVRSNVYAVARQQPAAGAAVPRGARVRLFLVPALGQGIRHPPCKLFAGSRP